MPRQFLFVLLLVKLALQFVSLRLLSEIDTFSFDSVDLS
jgi:hypothetical protein